LTAFSGSCATPINALMIADVSSPDASPLIDWSAVPFAVVSPADNPAAGVGGVDGDGVIELTT
jgi:hypothetical protein